MFCVIIPLSACRRFRVRLENPSARTPRPATRKGLGFSSLFVGAISMKPCRKCGVKDRLPSGACKPCQVKHNRNYRAENAEKVKANRDRWRKENKEKLLEQGRTWKEKTYGIEILRRAKGQCKKCGGTKRFKSGGCVPCGVLVNQKYRAQNAAKVKANRDAWRAEKADVLNTQNHKRRALAKGRGVLSNNITETLYKQQNGECNCCGQSLGATYDLDHIMPLALGGANEDWNMQLLTSSCNRTKGAKNPLNFLISRAIKLAS